MNENLQAQLNALEVNFKTLSEAEYLELSCPSLDYHTIYCVHGENESLRIYNVGDNIAEQLEGTHYLGMSHTLQYDESGYEIVNLYQWLCKNTPAQYVLLRQTPYHYSHASNELTLVESQSSDDYKSYYTYTLLTRDQWARNKANIRLSSYLSLYEMLVQAESKNETA